MVCTWVLCLGSEWHDVKSPYGIIRSSVLRGHSSDSKVGATRRDKGDRLGNGAELHRMLLSKGKSEEEEGCVR